MIYDILSERAHLCLFESHILMERCSLYIKEDIFEESTKNIDDSYCNSNYFICYSINWRHFFDGLYQDNDFVNRVWLGNDIITLLLAIPIMIISLSLTIKGSFKATFIWLGTLWYMIYNLSFLFVWSYF